MPFFIEDFSDVIPEHLEHPMSSQVSQKSDVVSIALHKINSYIATMQNNVKIKYYRSVS